MCDPRDPLPEDDDEEFDAPGMGLEDDEGDFEDDDEDGLGVDPSDYELDED